MDSWTLRDEMQINSINLARAALYYARAIAYPRLNVADYMAVLHDLAEEAAGHVDGRSPAVQQAEQLSRFLFQVKGFRGHTEDYGDPRNSFLNDVLDRRLGIPITLSVLYLEVAGRLGVPAYGIGLPGHFIVGVHNDSEDLWLDPYFGGRWLTLADCADLLRLSLNYEGPIEAAWFAPAAPRTILARMLNNLRVTYVQRRMWPEAIAAIQQLRYIQPDVAEHLRDLGLVHYRQRSLPQAAHYLNAYLEQVPQAEDAQHIREGVKTILDEWAAMN